MLVASFWGIHSQSQLAWSVYIHQMNQANSRNGFVHDDSTTNIVVVVINDALTHWFGTVQDVKEELSESESSEAEESESPAADVSRKRRRVEIEYELETEQPTTSRLKL